MTEREKNGERLAMKISRHRQAKHEAIQYEDVKTAYIKGCEDTEKENADLPAIAYQQGAEAYKKKADSKLERAREIIGEYYDRSKDYPTCDDKLLDLRRRALAWLEGAEC